MDTLKSYFTKNGIAQRGIAKMLGITQGAVSKHLRGQGMRISTAKRYHEELDVPWELLINSQLNQENEQP